jgi:hypothetical protein
MILCLYFKNKLPAIFLWPFVFKRNYTEELIGSVFASKNERKLVIKAELSQIKKNLTKCSKSSITMTLSSFNYFLSYS